MTTEEQIASLEPCVREILDRYDFGAYEFESINHEFNSTFRVVSESGASYALRINVNSDRTLANLNAEIAWVNSIDAVKTPKPVANKAGQFVGSGYHEASARHLSAVVYDWLDGEEPGDEPTLEQVHAMGVAMARLHDSSRDFVLPSGAELPVLDDFLWGMPNLLMGVASKLDAAEQHLVAGAKAKIESVIAELQLDDIPQPIHADLHPWNVMWHEGELAVFDFDDSGIGLPVQDLATSLYYLDTDEQDQALLEGYVTVRPLPTYTKRQMDLLVLQRRLILLNYLHETSTPEHREMIPKYQAETMRRIAVVDSNQ